MLSQAYLGCSQAALKLDQIEKAMAYALKAQEVERWCIGEEVGHIEWEGVRFQLDCVEKRARKVMVEDRKKAEQDRLRAEQDRMKAEQDRKKAEQEREEAERDPVKANLNRKRMAKEEKKAGKKAAKKAAKGKR